MKNKILVCFLAYTLMFICAYPLKVFSQVEPADVQDMVVRGEVVNRSLSYPGEITIRWNEPTGETKEMTLIIDSHTRVYRNDKTRTTLSEIMPGNYVIIEYKIDAKSENPLTARNINLITQWRQSDKYD